MNYKVDIKNSEFIAKFDWKQLGDMTNYLNENTRNKYYLNVEGCFDFDIHKNIDKQIDNIHIIFYPFKNIMPQDEVHKILDDENFDRSCKKDIRYRSKYINDYLKEELKKEVEERGKEFIEENYVYYLDGDQKRRVKELFNKYKTTYLSSSDNVPAIMTFIVHLVLPIPHIHHNRFIDDLEHLRNDFNLDQTYNTYRNNQERVIETIENDIKTKKDKGYAIDTREYLSQIKHYILKTDKELNYKYSQVNFIKYCMSNLYKDKTIYIEKKEYSSEKLRNSLIHFRWYMGHNHNIVLHDASPNHEKLYVFNYKETINIDDFFEVCRQYAIKEKYTNI